MNVSTVKLSASHQPLLGQSTATLRRMFLATHVVVLVVGLLILAVTLRSLSSTLLSYPVMGTLAILWITLAVRVELTIHRTFMEIKSELLVCRADAPTVREDAEDIKDINSADIASAIHEDKLHVGESCETLR